MFLRDAVGPSARADYFCIGKRHHHPRVRALAAETQTLERPLCDLVNQAYVLALAEIALMWQTAPPRMPIPPP